MVELLHVTKRASLLFTISPSIELISTEISVEKSLSVSIHKNYMKEWKYSDITSALKKVADLRLLFWLIQKSNGAQKWKKDKKQEAQDAQRISSVFSLITSCIKWISLLKVARIRNVAQKKLIFHPKLIWPTLFIFNLTNSSAES